MSKSCAFLERNDGSRYIDLFRALHLLGITDSTFHYSQLCTLAVFRVTGSSGFMREASLSKTNG